VDFENEIASLWAAKRE